MEKIDIIIDNHIKNNEYILEIEYISTVLEEENIPYGDRKKLFNKIYEHNKKVYKLEKSKANQLQKMELSNQTPMVIYSNDLSDEIQISKKQVETIKTDVNSYLNKVLKTDNLDEIISFLPQRDNPNFDNILSVLLIRLYKAYVETLNFINSQKDRQSFAEAFSSDLDMISSKMEIILEYKENVVECDILNSGNNNRIMFLKNSSGMPVIFQNLKGYEEYYDIFLDLLNSIVDGTFKNLRMFFKYGKLVNMYEVKYYEARILFARLKDNTYVILSGFMKKCVTDLRHRNLIENTSQTYQNQKDNLLNYLNDDEYMQKEQMYLEQLNNMLVEKAKVKKK